MSQMQKWGTPPWMQQMREAAMNQIKESDIEKIVAKQVEKAKAGDERAVKFVFEQVLGGAAFKGATIRQTNNYYGDGEPEDEGPSPARGGTKEKVELMRRRYAKGLPLCREDDGPDVDLS